MLLTAKSNDDPLYLACPCWIQNRGMRYSQVTTGRITWKLKASAMYDLSSRKYCAGKPTSAPGGIGGAYPRFSKPHPAERRWIHGHTRYHFAPQSLRRGPVAKRTTRPWGDMLPTRIPFPYMSSVAGMSSSILVFWVYNLVLRRSDSK